jgi:murein DD-endopeptidase MepM/ murein hydrolase activator NlpD
MPNDRVVRCARASLLAVVCVFGAPAAAAADPGNGGTSAPDDSGGVGAGQRLSELTTGKFSVTPAVQAGGRVRFAYRVDGPARVVRVRIELVRERRVALRLRLGRKATGRVHRTERSLRDLPAGTYTARLHAVDAAGRKLARASKTTGRRMLRVVAPPPAPAPAPASPAPSSSPPAARKPGSAIFPVQGPWSFGGEDATFGAPRGGRLHRGQDIIAAEGTPLVSPRAGSVYFRDYQAGGAGHYVVIRGDDGRDYMFMHMVGPTPHAKGARVAAGQRIGLLGNTGSSSGPHLHFEIWPDGWYAPGSEPIDPRPELEAWARG